MESALICKELTLHLTLRWEDYDTLNRYFVIFKFQFECFLENPLHILQIGCSRGDIGAVSFPTLRITAHY